MYELLLYVIIYNQHHFDSNSWLANFFVVLGWIGLLELLLISVNVRIPISILYCKNLGLVLHNIVQNEWGGGGVLMINSLSCCDIGVHAGADDTFVILVVILVYSKMCTVSQQYRTRSDGLV